MVSDVRERVRDFRITFVLNVKKILISRVCKCATWNVFTMCRKKIYPSVCEDWRRLNLSKNPRYTFLTIKSSLRSHINVRQKTDNRVMAIPHSAFDYLFCYKTSTIIVQPDYHSYEQANYLINIQKAFYCTSFTENDNYLAKIIIR